jgi:hypothetical protein
MSSWNFTISVMALSSTARSCAGVISPVGLLGARLQQVLRAQEAADVVVAGGQVGVLGHE